MFESIKEFLRSPWTTGKLWATVSFPLSIAGIASIVQNFMDFGSLFVYCLVFYNKIFDPVKYYASILLPFDVTHYLIDYFVVGSPFLHSQINILRMKHVVNVMSKYFVIRDYLFEKFRKLTECYIIRRIFVNLPFLVESFINILFWPLYLYKSYVTSREEISIDFIFKKERDDDAILHSMEIALSRETLTRAKLVFFSFFILAALSFGIERWIDPDFLKLEPEDLGIGNDVEQPSYYTPPVR